MLPKQEAPQTIDAYIAGFPEDVQAILQQVRRTIHEACLLYTSFSAFFAARGALKR